MSVATLDDALQWLIIYTRCEEYIFDADADLPKAAQFACDMFWITPSDLCAKLRKLWPSVPSVPRPRAPRGLLRHPVRGVRV
jgi:hypothetical protein